MDPNYETGCNIADYDLNGFDLVKFWENGNLTDNQLERLRLDIVENDEDDLLGGPLSLPIISEKFKNILNNLVHNATFTSIAPAIRSSKFKYNWYLMEFFSSKLRESAYTDLDVFRCSKETAGQVVVSEKAVEIFQKNGLLGYACVERNGF